jgi:molybdate transport system substrate-binding protein
MADIAVMLSAAFRDAYLGLVPQFEQETGHRVDTRWVPSVEMMRRLKEGEPTDLVILAADSLHELIRVGLVEDCYALARSGIGVAVKAGAAKPDISSGQAVKRAMLAAKGIACSTGPSGVYLSGLFQRMGISEAVQGKLIRVQGVPAGGVVAHGDADIAFQQMSELLPVPGIDLVGPLPPDIQQITVFSVGIHRRASQPAAARALVEYFRRPTSAAVIREKGLEPA